MTIGHGVQIPLSEITLRASRSSGPGGQHANVTASRIEAVFDVAASEALGEVQKQLIMTRLGARVTAVAQDARSQSSNRELALARLQERLQLALRVDPPRTPTKPTRSGELRRLEQKRVQGLRKRARRRPGDGDE